MNELIIVGDKVLIQPESGERQTKTGLYLPATVLEQDRVGSGHVVRVGPGYIIPNPEYSESETWAEKQAARYIPLQARPGDFAFFLKKESIEITFEDKNYLIVPHSAIVALVRSDAEDILKDIDDIEGLFN